MVKDHSDSERGNPLPPHGLLFPINTKGFFYMHHPTDRIAHTTAFVTPVVEHWLERELAQWGHYGVSMRRPIAPWANALTTELHLAPVKWRSKWSITAEGKWASCVWQWGVTCDRQELMLEQGTDPNLLAARTAVLTRMRWRITCQGIIWTIMEYQWMHYNSSGGTFCNYICYCYVLHYLYVIVLTIYYYVSTVLY